MMKKLISPICCLVIGVVVGIVLLGLFSEPKQADHVGPTATEFALSTLHDLHSGGESGAVQRSIAVTLAQMYIDAKGRDEITSLHTTRTNRFTSNSASSAVRQIKE